jgi:predicted small secreted protein
MKRKLAAVAALGALAAILAGCGNQGMTSSGSSINVFEVVVNGRYVECVSVGGQSVDCDWEGTR